MAQSKTRGGHGGRGRNGHGAGRRSNGTRNGDGEGDSGGEASGRGRPRPVWTGAISFGLVNVPVRLYTATSSHDVRFHEYQAKTGQRIHHKRVAEKSGREVEYKDIVKGYDLGRGRVVLLEPEEIEALEPRRSRSIDIEQFVNLHEIDPMVWDTTYYLGPGTDPAAAKSYELLRRALEESEKVAIGRFVMRTKEYLVTVRPLGKGLALETMHWPDEIRSQDDVTELPSRVNVGAKELGLARQLVDSLTEPWHHEKFADSYRDQVQDLIARKAKGEAIVAEEEPEQPAQVIDLMEALKASLGNGAGRAAPAGEPSRGGRAGRTGRSSRRASASKPARRAAGKSEGKPGRKAARATPSSSSAA